MIDVNEERTNSTLVEAVRVVAWSRRYSCNVPEDIHSETRADNGELNFATPSSGTI
jgi:hypothetical protein